MHEALCEELDGVADMIREGRIAHANSSRKVIQFGEERERGLINKKGSYALIADAVRSELDKQGEQGVASEFPQFVVETTTAPTPFTNGGSFREYFSGVVNRHNVLKQCVEEVCDGRLVDIGMMPLPLRDLERGMELVSTYGCSRYLSIYGKLREKFGGYALDVRRGHRRECVELPQSPLLGGCTLQFSPNVQFHPEIIGLAHDISIALGFAFAAFSNSPFMLGGVAEYGSRPGAWGRDMHREDGADGFSHGYLNTRGIAAFGDWTKVVAAKPSVLTFDDVKKEPAAMRPFPNLQLRKGQQWLQSVGFSWAEHNGQLNAWLELRYPDAQPTLLDSLALFMFYVGVVRQLTDEVDSADALIGHDEARGTFRRILADGPFGLDAKGEAQLVSWQGKDWPIDRLIVDVLIPKAIEGLKKEGIKEKESMAVFNLLERQLTQRRTGSYTLLRKLEEVMEMERCTEEEAIPKVISRLSDAQREQSLSMDDVQGIADITL